MGLRFLTGLFALAAGACAQQYLISTITGGAPPPSPTTALGASIGNATGIAADAAGNLYFAGLNCVFRLDSTSILTLVAGTAKAGYAGDGGAATSAQLNNPAGGNAIALDGAGNLFIADTLNARIRRVSPGGIITTVAGNGTAGYSGDNGPAVSAQLNEPYSVAVDSSGNLYIADTLNSVIRMVTPAGIITTVATGAQLSSPWGIAVDGSGNLFIADSGHGRVRKVSTLGVITTVAGLDGNGTASGDGGPAIDAQLSFPSGVAVDSAGNLYIADSGNARIRRVSSNGIITTVAGGGSASPGDGGQATSAELYEIAGVAVDSANDLYIAEAYGVRKVSLTGIISTVAGSALPANSGQLSNPGGVAVDGAGDVYIADTGNVAAGLTADNLVREISADGTMTTVAGNGSTAYTGDGGPAANAGLDNPGSVAVDCVGNLYIADTGHSRIRKVSPGGTITTIAGSGFASYAGDFSGDGGLATNARLNSPVGLAVDSRGNLYIADTANNRIRLVAANGVISTVAGNGLEGYSGDGGPGANASLYHPLGVAVDGAGNLYIADTLNSRIRMVSTEGVISTLAGNGGVGYAGDNGPAAAAQLSFPTAVAVDGHGDVFIADAGQDPRLVFNGGSARIRMVSAKGIITTVAGNGISGDSGDGGLATAAELTTSFGLAVGSTGDLYIGDTGSSAVRMLQPMNASPTIAAVLDAASESAIPVSPGKIVAIYGSALGPETLTGNEPSKGVFGTLVGGTTVSFNGIAAPIIYASATQIAAIAPYEISGAATAQVTVSYQGQVSPAFTVPVAASAPSLFSFNATGAGQAAAVNADGSLNTAANPAKAGDYISFFATGEGRTSPQGVDGALAMTAPYPAPILAVRVYIGGIPAAVVYAGAAPAEVAGLMQVVVQIPAGVAPGGYVPVVLQVGAASTVNGAAWIAVSGN